MCTRGVRCCLSGRCGRGHRERCLSVVLVNHQGNIVRAGGGGFFSTNISAFDDAFAFLQHGLSPSIVS